MTNSQLQILQHSLGLDKHGHGAMFRNHFCAGGDDEPICRSLVELGYMVEREERFQIFPYPTFFVTNEGKAAVLRESPQPPKLTRSQQRYRAFLAADSGMTFLEWMKAEKAREQAVAKWSTTNGERS